MHIPHVQTLCDKETLYVKNQLYTKNCFIFPFVSMPLTSFIVNSAENKAQYNEMTITNPIDTERIEDPVFVVDTIDDNWTHAVVDGIIVWYWTYQKCMPNQEVVFFIRRRLIDYYPDNLKNLDSSDTYKYKPVYEELLSAIPHSKVIFEHKIPTNKTYCFQDCYHHILESNHQRSILNGVGLTYTSKEVYANAKSYVHALRHSLNIYSSSSLDTKKHVIIIEQKYNQFFDDDKLYALEKAIMENQKASKTSYEFDGTIVLEDMCLKEQLELFSRTHIFFFRHGPCVANLLWAPNKSLVFDIDDHQNRTHVVQRICDATQSRSIPTCYDTFDVPKMIATLNAYLESG